MANQPNNTRGEEFVRGYLTAALWSSSDTIKDSDGEEIDVKLENYEWGREQEARLGAEALRFLSLYINQLEAFVDRLTIDPSHGTVWDSAGHDLWLTRNGHGAGFWDRGAGEPGAILTELCGFRTEFDQVDLYLGDDELVYACGHEPPDYEWNSESRLPPVDCPLVVLAEGWSQPVTRTCHLTDKGGQMNYLTQDGRRLVGRFPWTYP